MMDANTLFLRLEGPLQAWGDTSKFVMRRTMPAPTKSGVFGMLCAAMGIPRAEAAEIWLPRLAELQMGVRIDRPGTRWWDYHTVGAGIGLMTAAGKLKTGPQGTLITRREYLADAGFLVALQGEPALIDTLAEAVKNPRWTPYLGRKCCPPCRPLWEHPPATFSDVASALTSLPWQPRFKDDPKPKCLDCLIDWTPTAAQPEAPLDAQVWYDVPLTFEPPSHRPRFVIQKQLDVGNGGQVHVADQPAQNRTPPPPRPRANYNNAEYKRRRAERLQADWGLCVFCKLPATTVQHVTYRRAGGKEEPNDLRSLCRLCHDAVTMIEYGLGMGLDRINPQDPQWRDRIIAKRDEIVRSRSLETRRRRLSPEEVE